MSECPQRNSDDNKAKTAAVAFAMSAHLEKCGAAAECFLTEAEMKRGLVVMDCGATGSLGGVEALEHLSDLRGNPTFDFC